MTLVDRDRGVYGIYSFEKKRKEKKRKEKNVWLCINYSTVQYPFLKRTDIGTPHSIGGHLAPARWTPLYYGSTLHVHATFSPLESRSKFLKLSSLLKQIFNSLKLQKSFKSSDYPLSCSDMKLIMFWCSEVLKFRPLF